MTENTETEAKLERQVPAQEGELLTPGGQLAQVREQKGLSIQAVASQLRITRSKLLALESDSYDQFPSETFVKGYLRAYSRLLGLDEEQQISRYVDYQRANAEVSQLMQAEELADVPLPVKWKFLPLAALLLVLVGLFVFWPAEREPAQVRTAAPATPAAVEPAQPGQAAEQSAVIATQTESEPELPQQQAEPTQVPADSPVAALPVARAPDVLLFDIGEDCWIEVSDAKGDVLATDLMTAGSSLRIEGKAPFNVMLGNARAVRVSINGRPVESDPKAGSRALRFSVE